jgi:hypothetical protein
MPSPRAKSRAKASLAHGTRRSRLIRPCRATIHFGTPTWACLRGLPEHCRQTEKYKGALGYIEVAGHTDVPNFMLTDTNNPVHLAADYDAIIDGTDAKHRFHHGARRDGVDRF